MQHTAPSVQTLTTGFVVAVVGFFSSFPIVLEGLRAVGASHAEAASGLMAAAISMGLAGIVLSLVSREPVSVAWRASVSSGKRELFSRTPDLDPQGA